MTQLSVSAEPDRVVYKAAIAAWKTKPRTTPRDQPYSSALAIMTALTLRSVFRLALRQTEGLIDSIIWLLGLDLAVPDHSTLTWTADLLLKVCCALYNGALGSGFGICSYGFPTHARPWRRRRDPANLFGHSRELLPRAINAASYSGSSSPRYLAFGILWQRV